MTDAASSQHTTHCKHPFPIQRPKLYALVNPFNITLSLGKNLIDGEELVDREDALLKGWEEGFRIFHASEVREQF